MAGDDWTIQDVVGLLRDDEGVRRQCCLLIGAGVSRSAGIATGAEFIAIIRKRHPQAYSRAERLAPANDPSYADCMGELTEAQRAALVREQIERAQINWAHIGIARLEEAGYVDRILTTNFDPLASRACALFNQFPAVYDLAALRDADGTGEHARFIPAFVSGSAIYHLHGQHTGFLLLNTEALLEQQAQRIEPALQEAVTSRIVIVCGYSGENDPLVDRLRLQGGFPHGLIWVRPDADDPCEAVCDKLLGRFGDCHVVRNMSADRFFTDLANALDLPQPGFLIRPFHHMNGVLEKIRPFSDIADGQVVDLLEQARARLSAADALGERESPHQDKLTDLMAQERYDQVLDEYLPDIDQRSDAERSLVAWAALGLGNLQYTRAKEAASAEVEEALAGAEEKFRIAITLSPEMSEAYLNLGNVFFERGKRAPDGEADGCFLQAQKHYEKSLAILRFPLGIYNLANTLIRRASLAEGDAADSLFRKGHELYEEAVGLDPKMTIAWSNWGSAYSTEARTRKGPEADRLLLLALEKSRTGLESDPNDSKAHSIYADVMAHRAELTPQEETDKLIGEAFTHYERALELDPTNLGALENWGSELLGHAKRKQGEERAALLEQAMSKLEAADEMHPHCAAYNMACANALAGRVAETAMWLRRAKEGGNLPSCAHILADPDLDDIRQDPAIRKVLEEIGCKPA